MGLLALGSAVQGRGAGVAAFWVSSTLWNLCTMEQIRDTQSLFRQNILRLAFLDCKLIECINKLKECVPPKWDESGNETQESQFANISSISSCRVQRRVSIPFRTTASRPAAAAADAAKSLQSCLTLCDPIDDLLPGSSVPGILQARTLEWCKCCSQSLLFWAQQTNHEFKTPTQQSH